MLVTIKHGQKLMTYEYHVVMCGVNHISHIETIG